MYNNSGKDLSDDYPLISDCTNLNNGLAQLDHMSPYNLWKKSLRVKKIFL